MAVDAPVMVVAVEAVASAAVASRRAAWATDAALAMAVVVVALATGMVATEVVDTRASIRLIMQMQTTLVSSVDLNSKWEAALDVKLT